jgi:hypothetical protein
MTAALDDLNRQVAYLAKRYKKVDEAHLPDSIATHYTALRTDPAILIAALVDFCADACAVPRQYWDRVDEISDRIKGRYRLKEAP